jgi:uncharacterized caspase-like protein
MIREPPSLLSQQSVDAISSLRAKRSNPEQQMLTRVRAEVVGATKAKQVPWSNSSLLGEVYLGEKRQ